MKACLRVQVTEPQKVRIRILLIAFFPLSFDGRFNLDAAEYMKWNFNPNRF